jgi:cell division protein FtsI (penicillin-binding protein 3)
VDRPSDLPCDRIVSTDTSDKVRALMRLVAEKSSGRNANIPGYEIGGKTGTAYQVKPEGGYDRNKRFNSFVALWPTSDPEYLMFISLDDPKLLDGSRRLPLAGHTAAPTAGRALERIAPLLGMVPKDRFRNGIGNLLDADG